MRTLLNALARRAASPRAGRRAATLLSCVTLLAAHHASAMPRHAADAAAAETALVPAQNRFLPGFLGGGNKDEQDAASVRLDQLEAQVRMLTGQVEELTFTVRRLEAALARATGEEPGAAGRPGPGAPPRDLGTLPAPGGSETAAAPDATAAPQGPIDLSVLNQGGIRPQPDDTARIVETPVTNDALASARELYESGRYSLAADEARAILDGGPAREVAGEARFLLGEALLAQGDYRSAANLFLENYTSDPNSARAPESLLRLGTALNGLGEREAACSSLEELFGAYPNVGPELRAAAERERQAANCA